MNKFLVLKSFHRRLIYGLDDTGWKMEATMEGEESIEESQYEQFRSET